MRALVYIWLAIFVQIQMSSAQAPPSLNFGTPTLFSGTANSSGAIYKYTNVTRGVDAYVTILSRTGTAAQISINTFDAAPGTGYSAAFQPVIDFKFPFLQNDRIGIVFQVDFKTTAGATYTFTKLAMTVIDCDGINSGSDNFRETVASSNVYNRNVLSPSLTFSTDSFFNITSSGTNFAAIDSSNTPAMCQLNYINISRVKIKCGAFGSSSTATTTRQYCLYFKPFSSLTLPLPISLLDFSVAKKNKSDRSATITWSTASETNNDYFEIERKHERETSFVSIVKVKGVGNSTIINSYKCLDTKLERGGIYYYRLKQVDFNGAYSYGPIKAIKQEDIMSELITLAENPIQDKLTLKLNSDLKAGLLLLSLFDGSGQVVWKTENEPDRKSTYQVFNIGNVARGAYTLRIGHSDYSEVIGLKVFVE